MICTKCKIDKNEDEFYKSNKNRCKECIKKINRKSDNKPENKQRKMEYQRKYRSDPNKREKLRLDQQNYHNKNIHKVWAYATIYSHKKRYNVYITVDELTNIAKNTTICPICKTKFNWIYGKGCTMSNSPTLDRLNNENDITINNIQILCLSCNTTKSHRTVEEMDKWILQWQEYRKMKL